MPPSRRWAGRLSTRQAARERHEEREGEAAVQAALAAVAGIRTARLVGTGNATVARIAAEMRQAMRES
jgi:hypothetical protein